ncbi:MAG TPA: pyrimidine dimer DNA glycosylase/endonuclease V [bacterium]
MRLWSLHSRCLDAQGLVALWREALLAQAVLLGRTRGYRYHPQLTRFRETRSPAGAIAAYLRGVHEEAARRGYQFDAGRIVAAGRAEPIAVTRGQLDYEWEHLANKLRVRAPEWLAGLGARARPVPHPIFRVVPGPVEAWERMSRG